MTDGARRRTVLITGTTSGLGHALLRHYDGEGHHVVSVNRRAVPELAAEFPSARFLVADITQVSSVEQIFKELEELSTVPEVLILNAGVNGVDNESHFDFGEFKRVWEVNLSGVLTFIDCVQRRGVKGTTIVGISSTSTIVPNSRNLGYYASKLSIRALFRLFSLSDRANRYKVVVLGPVHTMLNRNLPKPSGLQGVIFDRLSLQPGDAARRCAKFIGSRRRVLYPPALTSAFYAALRAMLIFVPSLYYRAK
jgi:short-subunit dehydrogenase